MDSTADKLNAPMSLAKKTFLSTGGALILTGALRAGSAGKNYTITRKTIEELVKAKDKIQTKYAPIYSKLDSDLIKKHKAIDASFLPFKNLRKTFRSKQHAANSGLEMGKSFKEMSQAEHEISKNKDKIVNSLNPIAKHLDKLDVILPAIGITSIIGGLLTEKKAGLLEELIKASREKAKSYNGLATEANVGIEKKASLSIQATKESQDKPKYLPRPNLLAGKPDYERKDQMQPVHETVDSNATKIANAIGIKSIHNGELHLEDGSKKKAGFTLPMLMALHKGIKEHPNKSFKVSRDGTITFVEKVASAVNSIFPKVSKEEIYNKEIQKQTKKVDKHKLLLANSEMAHQEKDMQLKKMKSAIKDVNKKLEHYRGKAIEHFTNHLDTEANAV